MARDDERDTREPAPSDADTNGDGAPDGSGDDMTGEAYTDAHLRPRIARARRSPVGRPSEDGDLRIAAIDIGSNSIRQIVADVSADGKIRVVDEMKAMPRLGAGVDERGALAEESIRAALSALTRMATLARQMNVDRIEAVATSAVRDAANGGAFLERVRAETGLRVRVLTGQVEARLAFRSALAHFELGTGRTVVMDIGGGSLELALAADGLVDRLASFPFGAIRTTEQFLAPAQRAGRERVERLERAVRELRRAVRWAVRDDLPVKEWRGARVIGSGGTFTNLAAVVNARAGLQTPRARHGTVVPRADAEHVLAMLASMTPAERAAVPGLNPQRADIIVAGLAAAAEVLAVFEARELRVSGYGIREGLLLESARVIPRAADPGEARERSVREFAERCHYEEPHARQVRRLALQLFDQLAKRLGCEPGDREILADAALLHDVGYHISYETHHKHSYHLILHADLFGISPAEQVAIANVARYHRGTPPRKKHDNFGPLDRALRRRIRRLAACLRVADGLDRGHVQAVDRVDVTVSRDGIRLAPVPISGATLRLELWGADRKSQLLAAVADAPVEVVAPDGSTVVDAYEGRRDE